MVMWLVVRVCISLSVVKAAAAKALDERACLEHPAPGARLLWAVCCRVPAHAMDERDLRGGSVRAFRSKSYFCVDTLAFVYFLGFCVFCVILRRNVAFRADTQTMILWNPNDVQFCREFVALQNYWILRGIIAFSGLRRCSKAASRRRGES